jgi:hypothetical protein
MSLTENLPHDLEALADSLSTCADELHARLMRALRHQQPMEKVLPQGTAQAMFENEVALRQQANNLYVDAAAISLRGMGATQQELLELAAQARRRIREINLTKDLVGLSADLLGMAAAVATMHPERLLSAVQNLKARVASLHDDKSA